MEIWSNTVYPYDCLLDFNRTKAFQAAIRAVVEETRLTEGRIIQARVSYQMSGGLDSLRVTLSEE